MADTTARLLELLTTFQLRPLWSGPELAARFEVSERTVRNDVERLRALGYPIEAARGRAGGYRFGAGGRLPPLLLEQDEAVAVAIGLQSVGAGTADDEAARRARTKLEQLLAPPARALVDAIGTAVERAPENLDTDADDPDTSAAALAQIAAAVRDQERLRFEQDTEPAVTEPHRLLSWHRRWYLVGRDPATREWNVHRVDRIDLRPPTGRRFVPSPPPEGGYAAFAIRRIATTGWTAHARLRIAAPATRVSERINPAVGVVEAVTDRTSILHTGADSLHTIAAYIGMLDLDFTVDTPDELNTLLDEIADRYKRAVQGPGSAR